MWTAENRVADPQVPVLDRLARVQDGGLGVGVDGGACEQDRAVRVAGQDEAGILQGPSGPDPEGCA